MHQGTIEVKCSQRCVTSVLFTGDGKQVLSCGDEGVIRQWRVEDGKEVCEPIRAKGEIYAIALSSDGKWLACGLRPSLNRGSRNFLRSPQSRPCIIGLLRRFMHHLEIFSVPPNLAGLPRSPPEPPAFSHSPIFSSLAFPFDRSQR